MLIATEQQYKLQYVERGLKDLLNECFRKHIFTRWKIAAHNSFGKKSAKVPHPIKKLESFKEHNLN